ncbi:DUF1242-domain-containing protein [Lactarius pseudohatsudake]|nr:DUF1242-domain-containing protein [Lactarius pseudohatsudake]
MSASLLLVNLLLICARTYVRAVALRLIDNNKQGFFSCQPSCQPESQRSYHQYVALACVAIAVWMIMS